MPEFSRREFLTLAAAAAGTGLASRLLFNHLRAARAIENPLAYYPERGWEDVYREQYRYDSAFRFVCSPNCTHACRMIALRRNGVILRTEPAYDVERYADLFGNTATAAWHPRGCSKAYTIHRRLYGAVSAQVPDGTQGLERVGG